MSVQVAAPKGSAIGSLAVCIHKNRLSVERRGCEPRWISCFSFRRTICAIAPWGSRVETRLTRDWELLQNKNHKSIRNLNAYAKFKYKQSTLKQKTYHNETAASPWISNASEALGNIDNTTKSCQNSKSWSKRSVWKTDIAAKPQRKFEFQIQAKTLKA